MALWRDDRIVPVLMYHSIGPRRPGWAFAELSEGVASFAGTLEALHADGYRSVGLSELYDHMAGRRRLDRRSVVITFDDGYLDNWVHAVPLLRQYGMQATVYVTPEFVEDSTSVRPQSPVPDASGIDCDGFMSWGELAAAQTEGVLDVQSHAMTHTWYFSGPRLVDVHRPRVPDPHPWLAWNARPDRKPYYLSENQQPYVPWGYPVFEHEKSLVVRRFEPDEMAVAVIVKWVEEQGGAGFFDQADWRGALTGRFPELAGAGSVPGRFETPDEQRARVFGELSQSRAILEERLGKPVRFFAWPGGGVDADVVALAREVGYLSWTLSSWQEKDKRNRPGTDPSGIKRVSGSGSAYWRGRPVGRDDPWWVIQRVRAHQGDVASRLRIAWRKLRRAGRADASAGGQGA